MSENHDMTNFEKEQDMIHTIFELKSNQDVIHQNKRKLDFNLFFYCNLARAQQTYLSTVYRVNNKFCSAIQSLLTTDDWRLTQRLKHNTSNDDGNNNNNDYDSNGDYLYAQKCSYIFKRGLKQGQTCDHQVTMTYKGVPPRCYHHNSTISPEEVTRLRQQYNNVKTLKREAILFNEREQQTVAHQKELDRLWNNYQSEVQQLNEVEKISVSKAECLLKENVDKQIHLLQKLEHHDVKLAQAMRQILETMSSQWQIKQQEERQKLEQTEDMKERRKVFEMGQLLIELCKTKTPQEQMNLYKRYEQHDLSL